MNVAEVATRTGLSPHTIRYYDKMGLLPPVERSSSGARQFSEGDVAFIQFLIGLKKTGMSLEEIAHFTADGCILERLQQGIMPTESVAKRVSILTEHRERLLEQRRELDFLLQVADEKLGYYERYLTEKDEKGSHR